MSDSKQKGNRDISDLKARLGLKKGAQAPATGQTRANGGAGGGVVAPPGMNLPPPPGMAAPQPAQPAIPNAADDPFGAMNAMAAVGNVQRAPEIVIVNDGKPVENVGHQSTGRKIATMAIPGVIALVVGVAIGKIGQGASTYNASLSDVKVVLGDKGTPSTVSALKQELSQLDTLLDEKAKNAFRPDPKLDAELSKSYKDLEIKSEIVWRAKENAMDADVSAQIMSFYAGVTEVRAMIDAHVKAARFDDALYKKGKEKADAAQLKPTDVPYFQDKIRYAVMVQAPTESDKVEFGAKIVELVALMCNGKAVSGDKCPEGEGPSGFQYRTEPGGGITEGELAGSGQDTVPSKKLLLLLPGGVRDALVKTADGVASEAVYQRRLRMIYERIHGTDKVKGLLDEGNKLETRLEAESNKSRRFSFFM